MRILWLATLGLVCVLAAAQAEAAAAPRGCDYDAILLVGGKPDAVEVPSLDMVLRARKACQLMLENKAYYLLISGKEFNNSASRITVTDRREWVDRSKEERIQSGEMLVLMAFARGVGRMAIKFRPDPKDIAPLCQEKKFTRILCFGDGRGPEKPVVDGLKRQGAQITFVAPYASLEAGKKELEQDCVLTEEDRAGLRRQFAKIDPTFNVETDFAKNGLALIKGGGGTMAGDGPTGVLGAIKLYKAGYAKVIFPTGGSWGYINDGEVAAILCECFGVPASKVVYAPAIGSSDNLRSGDAWGRANNYRRGIVCGSWGASGASPKPKDPHGMRYWVWGLGRGEFKSILPRDKDRKIGEILAELDAEIAKAEEVLKNGTAQEKAAAQARLSIIGKGKYGQYTGARQRMEIGFTCGRMWSFPTTPWDYDGISRFPAWVKEENARAALRGVVGSGAVRVWDKQLKGEDQVKYMIHDLGSRGPWQEYMDAKILVVPDRWVKYPPEFKKKPSGEDNQE